MVRVGIVVVMFLVSFLVGDTLQVSATSEDADAVMTVAVDTPAVTSGTTKEASKPPRKTGNEKTERVAAKSTTSQNPEEIVEQHFSSGLLAYQNREYRQALEHFTAALTRSSKADYLFWIGKCHGQLKNRDSMFSSMEKVVALFPESDVADDAFYELAEYFQNNNDYQIAVEKFTRLTEQYPEAKSALTGEMLMPLSLAQRRKMTDEVVASLNALGFQGGSMTELLTQFQKVNKLPMTGMGDPETIKKVKESYGVRLKAGGLLNSDGQIMPRFRTLLYLCAAFLVINLIALVFFRIKIGQTRNGLENLRQASHGKAAR